MQAAKYELELLAIRTLCAGKDAGVSLLNQLTPAHFHHATTQLMYRRIMARLKGEGSVPAWNDLINDATIPEDKKVSAQRLVRIKGIKPLVPLRKGEALLASLDRYRKLRAAYELINKAGNAIKQPASDIDQIVKNLKSEAIAIDVNQRGTPITVDGTRKKHVVEAFTNADARVKTGHKEFDTRSGGIPQGAVFLMGADTGGFKSAEALEMASNMAKNKRRVGFYSLEMTSPEVTQRQTSSILEIDGGQMIIDYINKLDAAKSKAEIAKIKEAMQAEAERVGERFEQATKDWIDFLHITCPADEVDINWILQQAELSDREIIFIDYVGLLAGLNGQDQWLAMSNVVRQCKIWTNRTGKTIIVLAQVRFVDGRPELKYSKAVLDHCNNFWAWSRLEVNGRTYLCVHQPKARGQKPFPFVLRVFPEYFKVCDLKDSIDEEVARLAIEDMRTGADPMKRYNKEVNKNEEKGRRLIDIDDEEPLLRDGGFAGGHKSYDTSGLAPWDEDDLTRKKIREIGNRVTASGILKQAKSRTRAVALAKLKTGSGSLDIEEAAIQAEEVIRRWEEASAGHRISIDKLAKELLGLTQTKEMLTQIRRIQGDSAARKRLSPRELEIHKAQIDVVKLATETIRTKGKEYVKEDDFYAKDDLTLAVERGEEPIASPKSLDRPWQENALAWADQPAITLPNSAKPKDRRWGTSGDEESVKHFKRVIKSRASGEKITQKLVLWPPKGKLDNYHYLDDIQLDSAVNLATKIAAVDLTTVPVGDLADMIDKYVELVGPGRSRVHNRKHKRLVINDKTYDAAVAKFGL